MRPATIITTKYLGPTNYRTSRVKATSTGGAAVTVAWDHSLGPAENHDAAAAAVLCELRGPGHSLHDSGTLRGLTRDDTGYIYAIPVVK